VRRLRLGLRVLLAVAVAVVACASAASADTATVRGVVRAADGTPIAFARVVLIGNGLRLQAASDTRGRFRFERAEAGTYDLNAAAPGYQPLSQRTVTVGTQGAELVLVLSRATTASLTVIGDVESSAGETVSTASGSSVSLPAQRAAAAGVVTVSSMLWSELSTTPVLPLGGGSDAPAVFAVRGPDPTETLVEIDGHPVNNGNTGDFDLSLVDPASLQAVQLVKGISPSSLLGPNTIGGAVNVLTLEPTSAEHVLMRISGGSYASFGETLQSTGTQEHLGYAVSLHAATSAGAQPAGSGMNGDSLLAKLRYQLGGRNGYGYVQLDVRDQTVSKDLSALLAPYGEAPPATSLGAQQSNEGLDAQLPIGNERSDGLPATLLQFSHLTTVAGQSIDGPGLDTLPYLYDQRDAVEDDWLEADHRFSNGTLSFKYDLSRERLGTDYVQGQVTAQSARRAALSASNATPPTTLLALSQVQRSAVFRYDGDPTSHIHYSLAAYASGFSTFGTSFDPRAGFVWTPSGDTAVRVSVGTTFQTPQLSELVVPPPNDRVPIGGVIYLGNASLQPDHATEYDLGVERVFGALGRELRFSLDAYQSNLRSPASQLNVTPVPNCGTPGFPSCPVSMPVNAGNAVYRGAELRAQEQIGSDLVLRAGWSVNSSYLTVVPPSIQDGTLVPMQQTLGEPLHKAFAAVEASPSAGLAYGAEIAYEGAYNELHRPPYATLAAHVALRRRGYEIGLYGTNLTNVYADPLTIVGEGVPYGTLPGNPMTPTDAYVLQGRTVVLVLTRSL
jgi:outer membrane receptor protein involved in Fe transport